MTKDSTSNPSTSSSVRKGPSLMKRLLGQLEEVNMPIAPDEEPEKGAKAEDSPSQNTDEK